MKNFLYNKGDIFVCLLILVIAAGIIFWRVDVIMAYPEIAAKAALEQMDVDAADAGDAQGDEDQADTGDVPGDDGTLDGGTLESGSVTGDESGSESSKSDKVHMYAIYINYGDTMDTIADNCVALGLVESREEFYQLVEENGVESKIKAGQHYIPSNATHEELIENLITPGE